MIRSEGFTPNAPPRFEGMPSCDGHQFDPGIPHQPFVLNSTRTQTSEESPSFPVAKGADCKSAG